MFLLFFVVFIYSLSPSHLTSSLEEIIQIQEKKPFEIQLTLENLCDQLLNQLDDIPLILGSIPLNGKGFRSKFFYQISQLRKKNRKAGLFFLELFYRDQDLGAPFYSPLIQNQEFMNVIYQYKTLREVLFDIYNLRFINNKFLSKMLSVPISMLSLFHFDVRDDFTFLFNLESLQDMDIIEILLFIQINPHVILSVSFIQSVIYYLRSKHSLLDCHIEILYRYDRSLSQRYGSSDIKDLILPFVKTSHTLISMCFDYQDELIRSSQVPLYLFSLEIIERNYNQMGFTSLLDFLLHIVDQYPKVLRTQKLEHQYLIHKQPSLDLLLDRMERLSFSCLIYIWMRVSLNQLTLLQQQQMDERVDTLKNNSHSSCSFECSIYEEWKKNESDPFSHKNFLFYWIFLDEFPLFEYLPDTEQQKFLALQPLERLSLLRIRSPFILKNFPLPAPSSLSQKLNNFDEKQFSFQADHLLTPPWIYLKDIHLLGRTVYGYDDQLQKWVAYKFLKKGETYRDLMWAEYVYRCLDEEPSLESNQKTMGLWKNSVLSFHHFMEFFPEKLDDFQLFQWEKNCGIVYRKYTVSTPLLFHYPYESLFSFDQACQGVHLSLKQAGEMWNRRCYLTSIASCFHNLLEGGRRYFPGIFYIDSEYHLGKISSWNWDATNYCDMRVGGLVDKEDLLLKVNDEWNQMVKNSVSSELSSYYKSEEQFLAVNTLLDFLFIADLLILRKYFDFRNREIEVSTNSLKTAIKWNYISLWCSLVSSSLKEAQEIFSDSSLFPWDVYIDECLQYLSVDFTEKSLLERGDDSACNLLYNKGLIRKNHYKDTVSSIGDNLGGYNDSNPISSMEKVMYSFTICLFHHLLRQKEVLKNS